MIQFKTRSLDLLVTPNHRMVVDIAQSGKRKFVEAKDFDVNNHRIPKQSVWKGVEQYFFILPSIEFTKYGRQGRTPYSVVRGALQIKMDSWLAFFGFWLAEGSTDNEKIAKRHGYRVFISQVNPKKRMEIKEILRLLPFAFAEEGANLVICNKQLWTYLRQFGNKYQKFIPKEILALSSRQLKILFDWMVKGDGHIRRTTGQINYWTASKKLADTAQEVILKLGYLGTVIFRKGRRVVIRGRTVKGKGIYVLGVQTSNHYRLRKKNIHYSNYAGKVYCCEVQNNTVLVRRNGKVCWCGNSIGVVTLNLPKLGFMAKSKEEFFANLDLLMGAAKESLLIKRKILEKYTALGLYPYSKNYLRAIFDQTQHYWGNHFSTIGLIGMNECLLNLIGKDITDAEGQKLAGEILDNMREKITQFQVETGGLFNLEATPAEGTSYRLARLDKKRIPAIIVANEHAWQKDNSIAPYYTNSSHLPVNFTDDVFDALDRQDPLQVKYTGGTVLHTFIGEKKPSSEGVKQLVKTITQHYRLPYFTLTPTFSVCSNDGYLAGEHHLCPKCQEACEVYSRIVGYYRPIQNWNAGKQEEFKDRTLFELAKIRKGE
ncbi:hypothetical protein KKE06_01075 [Candidatus Micrarchaeota archaeon]|nr:hypothetical protein [Candidatus Micrarchaeota archaeon]MBU1930387.1 hypothetical protein [Candidatus Micrarchaeota archaeon]